MKQECIRTRITIITALLLACGAVAGRADDKAVSVAGHMEEDGIHVVARLTGALDVTMTVGLDLENLAPSVPLPVTVDSDGKTELPLVTLRIVDRAKPYKYGYRLEWKAGGRQKAPPKAFAYALPYDDGPHRVRQAFLGRFSHYQGSQDEYAVDWSMPVGTRVLAARAGTVVASRADVSAGGPRPEYKRDYNYVVLRHDDGTYAEYVHLDEDGVKVKFGDKVAQGDLVGLSGETGYTSEPHLHFAVFNTLSGRERRTIPIEFAVRSGKHVTLREGASY